MDFTFKIPANFYVCGQTQAGKSHFTRRMLRHLEELFYPVPTKIIYCYGEYQKGDKGGMANAKMYTFLEQNIVGKAFLWLHKLKHKLTFGIIYFLKI